MFNRFVGGNDDARNFLLQSVPFKRAGNPDEVAQTILFLASDKASYVTGHSFGVDGGRLAA
jgi:NAD(P)-dependent dehydrogenase (short-subunit alcohol dehydrogenase family)